MPENKDDIDLEGWDLHRAAKENRSDIVRAFVIRGDIDPEQPFSDMFGSQPYVWQAVDEYGRTALQVAAWYNSLDVARLLIEHGADIDAKSNDGNTPLHDAAQENSLDVASLLIDRGANTDGIDLSWMN